MRIFILLALVLGISSSTLGAEYKFGRRFTRNAGNPCNSQPCSNDGTCYVNSDGTKRCICKAVPDIISYFCSLDHGFISTTESCSISCTCTQESKDSLNSYYCANNGTISCNGNECAAGSTCLPYGQGRTYICSCPNGHNGTHCQNNYAGCIGNAACQNGGHCIPSLGGGYTCACRPGFSGEHCEQDYSGCNTNRCFNWATCIPTLGAGFTCACMPGYSGTLCEASVNGCESNPCLNDGLCSRGPNGTSLCQCVSAFYGPVCQYQDSCIFDGIVLAGCLSTLDGHGTTMKFRPGTKSLENFTGVSTEVAFASQIFLDQAEMLATCSITNCTYSNGLDIHLRQLDVMFNYLLYPVFNPMPDSQQTPFRTRRGVLNGPRIASRGTAPIIPYVFNVTLGVPCKFFRYAYRFEKCCPESYQANPPFGFIFGNNYTCAQFEALFQAAGCGMRDGNKIGVVSTSAGAPNCFVGYVDVLIFLKNLYDGAWNNAQTELEALLLLFPCLEAHDPGLVQKLRSIPP